MRIIIRRHMAQSDKNVGRDKKADTLRGLIGWGGVTIVGMLAYTGLVLPRLMGLAWFLGCHDDRVPFGLVLSGKAKWDSLVLARTLVCADKTKWNSLNPPFWQYAFLALQVTFLLVVFIKWWQALRKAKL